MTLISEAPSAGVNTPEGSDHAGWIAASPTQEDKYRYLPLDPTIDTIRVLKLFPKGTDGSFVRCELTHVTFRQKPLYEALSYTWGSPNQTEFIFIDGVKVPIRENLYHALSDLRYELEPRYLWADAICIDQSNTAEREKQVSIMDYIFSRAQSVIVWLGRPAFHTDRNCFRAFVHNCRRGALFWDDSWAPWILNNSYWRRLWIIQEIGLAAHVQVRAAGESVPWDEFAMAFYNKFRQEGGEIIENLDSKRRNRHGDSNRLEALLQDFEYACCTEPRDKIYGLLGFAHDCNNDELFPDYALPLYDLYKAVIEFFCQVRFLPSDATNELDRSMRLVKFSQLVQRLLSTSYQQMTQPAPDLSTLRVKGAIVSSILTLGPTYDAMISSRKANKQWQSIFPKHYPRPQDTQNLREAFEAYTGTLLKLEVADVDKVASIHSQIDPLRFWSFARARKRTWDGKPQNWDRQDPEDRLYVTPEDDQFCPPKVAGNSDGPRMFLGTNFRMGLVPCDAMEGDIICQFWETDIAALLRLEHQKATGENDDNSNRGEEIYRVVGRVHLNTGRLESLRPVYDPYVPIELNSDAMVIEMKVDTLSLLTC